MNSSTNASATNTLLPHWAQELRDRYLRGEAAQFILHGNVHDLVVLADSSLPVEEFLATTLLGASKDTVAFYNTSVGVRFAKSKVGGAEIDELLLSRTRDRVLLGLERLLVSQRRVAVILQYGETLVPAGDLAMMSEADRAALVTLHRWASLPAIESGDNIVLMLVPTLNELHEKLVNHASIGTVRIPLPGPQERLRFIAQMAPTLDNGECERLAQLCAGLKLVQIRGILAPHDAAFGEEERKALISSLLGEGADAARVDGLVKLTLSMKPHAIRDLLAPTAKMQGLDERVRERLQSEVAKHKREVIERECAGLLEFIEPKHGFEAVGGMQAVKEELLRVARALREGHSGRVPMGYLFVGPMGTGKTFVAEAFAKESGITAVKFGSFRSKWVGATESNLDRIMDVIAGMGQVIVIIDEVDRALAGNDGSSDGGTESRVIAKLKEFMSDTQNRGRILFLLMTNRPDLLDTDIKRTGRLDRKIPFFSTQDAQQVEPIVRAIVRRHRLQLECDLGAMRDEILAPLVGYSNADLEGVVLLAASLAETRAQQQLDEVKIGAADFAQAIADYLPSRDVNVIELMELLAVHEASNRSMLPEKYRQLASGELASRLEIARARVGQRR
jgi:ATP-dependent 26S proteasome regulatory subunit